ncbi:MAG: hypothetical protein R3286_09415 [Gammaproteobacteria bacterium]|nr:hypothetical protein [Gammaproteobacteria bacterium]
MLRFVLAFVTLALLIALGAIAARWARDHFVPAPAPVEVPADAPIRHLGFDIIAARALEEYRALPADGREAILANLRSNVVPLASWLDALEQRGYGLLCVGERHEDATRRFLAERVLPSLGVDVLMLEATSDELAAITKRVYANEKRVTLLGADIAAVIRAARRRNPYLVLAGIEEHPAQRTQRQDRRQGSRDRSITANLRSHLRPGKRHVAIFGALHCTDQPGWLYARIGAEEHRLARGDMLSVNVLGRHQDGTLEAFVWFLDSLGIATGDFAVPRTAALHRAVYEWFSPLTRSFAYYQAVVVFDEDRRDDTLQVGLAGAQ